MNTCNEHMLNHQMTLAEFNLLYSFINFVRYIYLTRNVIYNFIFESFKKPDAQTYTGIMSFDYFVRLYIRNNKLVNNYCLLNGDMLI